VVHLWNWSRGHHCLGGPPVELEQRSPLTGWSTCGTGAEVTTVWVVYLWNWSLNDWGRGSAQCCTGRLVLLRRYWRVVYLHIEQCGASCEKVGR